MATGVDFSKYKRKALYRRIIRRAVLHKMEGPRDYARFLQSNPTETDALYQDVLISVTRFLRNPEAFEVLKTKVFQRLGKDRSRHDPIRVWSIGCSTGEEAYSIAIALAEFSEGMHPQIPVQIFATDLSGAAIERARAGDKPGALRLDGRRGRDRTADPGLVRAVLSQLSYPPRCGMSRVYPAGLLPSTPERDSNSGFTRSTVSSAACSSGLSVLDPFPLTD